MRPARTISSGSSLLFATEVLRGHTSDLIVVLENGRSSGVVGQFELARALAEGADPEEKVGSYASEAETIEPFASGAEALRRFAEDSVRCLVVTDDLGHALGLLEPADLYPVSIPKPRPRMVGGMATPFGVYLTNGSIQAGVSNWALMTTGACLFGLLVVAEILSNFAFEGLSRMGVRDQMLNHFVDILPTGLFLLGMRTIPLSGIHAAEHQVVHAIERGEELSVETVRSMPRVHPRCGTNIAVGVSLFLGLSSVKWIPNEQLRLLLAAVVSLLLWRQVGGVVQQFITTKPASDKQLAMGIRSGNDLLEKFANAKSDVPPFYKRVWNSGMIQVIAGSSLLSLAIAGVCKLFGWDAEF